MIKTATLSVLLASGSMLSAQFVNLPATSDFTLQAGPQYEAFLSANGLNPMPDFTAATTLGPGWSSPGNILPDVNFDPNGFMRVFFIGKHAGWNNNLGVSFNPTAGDALSGGIYDENLDFNASSTDHFLFDASTSVGQFVQVPLLGATSLDFWLSTDTTGSRPERGGIWSMTDPDWNNPSNNQIQGRSKLLFDDDGNPIHILAFEDLNRNHPTSDSDFDDFVFGVQFFKSNGTPVTPVPEPSTYGVFAVLGLLGLVSLRRFKTKRA